MGAAAQPGHADTRITEKHFAHRAPSHVARTNRANFPRLGLGTNATVLTLEPRRSVKGQ